MYIHKDWRNILVICPWFVTRRADFSDKVQRICRLPTCQPGIDVALFCNNSNKHQAGQWQMEVGRQQII